ncbi:glycosyltransferase [Fructobacillus papyrifericola]|uniref:Glycosyltransferase n=1 Tax=Fructobacillus papyrifericola TaxID=2713172 RepID=A0ABS5QSL3_9LACO|nr:glycosyltransferase [Fructobacillus papyrifericola]MBS9336190.1 glycosyltransferase [Fructobacillus papyrifericola]
MNFFLNKGMGHGNSGVEHAQFYRLRAFFELGEPAKLVFTDLLPELHDHLKEWHLKEEQVINLYDYLMAEDPNRYLTEGLLAKEIRPYEKTTLKDFTKTDRVVVEQATAGYLIKRMKEKVWQEEKQLYLVSDAQVVLSYGTRSLSWAYRQVDGKREMTAILLENFVGQNYYFDNFYGLLTFFMDQIQETFGASRYFFDRGLDYDEYFVSNRSRHQEDRLIAVVHADHRLSNKGQNRVFNQFYQYLVKHLWAYDAVVVATRKQAAVLQDNLAELGYGKEAVQKVHTVPVGFVEQVMEKATPSVAKGDHPLSLVTASRLHPEKHIDQLVLVMAALKRAGIASRLTVYGSGQEEAALQQLIDEQGLSEEVSLAGFSQDLAAAFSKADLYLSASYSEGFGLTYLEALAQGLPVLSYENDYGAKELIESGRNGYLVDFSPLESAIPQNVQKMVEAVISAQGERHSLSKGALETAKRYRKEVVALAWRQLLEGLDEN